MQDGYCGQMTDAACWQTVYTRPVDIIFLLLLAAMASNMGGDPGVGWENDECGNLHGKFADRQSASPFAKGTMLGHHAACRRRQARREMDVPRAAVGATACKRFETSSTCDMSSTVCRGPRRPENMADRNIADEKLLT